MERLRRLLEDRLERLTEVIEHTQLLNRRIADTTEERIADTFPLAYERSELERYALRRTKESLADRVRAVDRALIPYEMKDDHELSDDELRQLRIVGATAREVLADLDFATHQLTEVRTLAHTLSTEHERLVQEYSTAVRELGYGERLCSTIGPEVFGYADALTLFAAVGTTPEEIARMGGDTKACLDQALRDYGQEMRHLERIATALTQAEAQASRCREFTLKRTAILEFAHDPAYAPNDCLLERRMIALLSAPPPQEGGRQYERGAAAVLAALTHAGLVPTPCTTSPDVIANTSRLLDRRPVFGGKGWVYRLSPLGHQLGPRWLQELQREHADAARHAVERLHQKARAPSMPPAGAEPPRPSGAPAPAVRATTNDPIEHAITQLTAVTAGLLVTIAERGFCHSHSSLDAAVAACFANCIDRAGLVACPRAFVRLEKLQLVTRKPFSAFRPKVPTWNETYHPTELGWTVAKQLREKHFPDPARALHEQFRGKRSQRPLGATQRIDSIYERALKAFQDHQRAPTTEAE
ncbi:hypothetical protein HY632_02335 [Candidatus Uhrbacteria bacterium]|nr:hypothetical protein [Candidatus Uhrbacteria bacterium]